MQDLRLHREILEVTGFQTSSSKDSVSFYFNKTLHPSVLERKIVSVCFSCPVGTTGWFGGNLIFGNLWIILTTAHDASINAKSSDELLT